MSTEKLQAAACFPSIVVIKNPSFLLNSLDACGKNSDLKTENN